MRHNPSENPLNNIDPTVLDICPGTDHQAENETVPASDQRHQSKELLSLLTNTQAYLEFLSANVLPDDELTQGWAQAYSKFDAVIRQLVAQHRVLAADQQEDCVQQVWLDVITRLALFEWNPERNGIVKWFSKLVRSEASNTKRKNAHNPTEDVDRVANTLATHTAEPSGIPDRCMQHEILRMVLNKLRGRVSNENYQIFVMRVLERRQVTEIAPEVQLTPKQVSDRVYYVKQRLRDFIEAVSD